MEKPSKITSSKPWIWSGQEKELTNLVKLEVENEILKEPNDTRKVFEAYLSVLYTHFQLQRSIQSPDFDIKKFMVSLKPWVWTF